MSLAAVPALDEILHDPTRIANLSPKALVALLNQAVAVQGSLASALAAALLTNDRVERGREADSTQDRMLTPDEAASLLRKKRRWIYRNADRLPFVTRVSAKSLLCSEKGIRRWLERRAKAGLTA